MAQRLGMGHDENRHWRRRCLDLESRRSALSGRCPDRKPPMSSVIAFIQRHGAEAGNGPRRKSSLATALSGSGISPISTFRALSRSETADEFGYRIYTEAWRRGWEWATTKIVIGDGAVWIWNLADQHFPGAVQIVDLYHARQHLWDIAALLYPHDAAAKKRWMAPMKDLLDHGWTDLLVEWLREIAAEHADANPGLTKEILTEAEYFETNTHRMQYPEFREQGFFVGSGVIEAGCKSIAGARLKRSGMFWTVPGSNAIIALRCSRHNGRFEDYWDEARAA